LIAEIVQLGGRVELERKFDLFNPPALPQFEAELLLLRDHIRADRQQRGWEL
jgi:hypothetical protein